MHICMECTRIRLLRETLGKSRFNLKEDMTELKDKHELELEKQKPLLLVGTAIRQRFLEQAQPLLPHYVSPPMEYEFCKSWGDGDKAIINLGNVAAHSSNLDGDAALFTCGFVDEEKEVGHDIGWNYAELFEAIY